MTKPIRLRFFVDEGVDFPLWGDEIDPGQLERILPIPDGLRARMRLWAAKCHRRSMGDQSGFASSESDESIDREGYQLSCELQEALGSEYKIYYSFSSASVRAESESAGAPLYSQGVQPRRLTELLRAVAVLALPASAQQDWLSSRGEHRVVDSLAIDIYETAEQAVELRDRRWIPEIATDRILDLNRTLNGMSGPSKSELWSHDALGVAPEWEQVRQLARSVLAEL